MSKNELMLVILPKNVSANNPTVKNNVPQWAIARMGDFTLYGAADKYHSLLDLQMQVKTVLCPVKTVSMGPETLLASLSDGKVYRNNRRLVLGAKDEKVHSDFYQ